MLGSSRFHVEDFDFHPFHIPSYCWHLTIDNESGFPRALVNAHYLNGLRTAAANAVASDLLACPNAQHLVLYGNGGQAMFEAQAVKQVRPSIREISVVARCLQSAARFAENLSSSSVEMASVKINLVEAPPERPGVDLVKTTDELRQTMAKAAQGPAH